ncbi:hypothetical protein [Streptomyces hygroscopicus]|uniref:hypothetical protein n=1 Tax=Streptomyces hygroscopicus TaxID=1912 RepID=UPI001FCB955F|nr:hypothetical protein [Streptomyces hygroscopicus]
MGASIMSTGCSSVKDSGSDPGSVPDARNVSEVKGEAREISSIVLDVIDLKGEVSKPRPGVSPCGDKGPDKFYVIHHPWSLTGVPVEDMKKAMDRLKKNLPGKGWKIVSYGPDASPSKSLELVADSTEKKFSISIRLLDRTKRANPGSLEALISVDLTSACFQVPEGKSVDEY